MNLSLKTKIKNEKNAIKRNVSIEKHKTRINITIKRFKKLYWFYFILCKSHHFLLFFSLTLVILNVFLKINTILSNLINL